MKISILRFLLFLGIVLPALFSCASLPAGVRGVFYVVKRGEIVPAFEDSSSDAELDLSFILIDTKKEGLRDLVRSYLYAGRSAEEYAADIISDLKTSYQMTLEENSDWGVTQSWSYNEEQTISAADRFVLISKSESGYMGGAHGNHIVSYYVFDMNEQRKLELAGLFLENSGMRGFLPLVERELRRFSQSAGRPLTARQPLSSGIYFQDTFTMDDFYPAKDGLHLQWDTYELAAYVYGAIDIVIDWKEIAALLSPSGADIAAAFGR